MAREYPLNLYRNFGIMAHIDAGKTTLRNASFTTPASPTRSAKSTTAPRRWIDGAEQDAASPSLRLPRPPSGTVRSTRLRVLATSRRSIASTSSTPPATSTSPSKSSVRWRFWMVRSVCWTPMPASSRKPKPCGVRLTATRFRVSSSSTRWTRSAPTSSTA